MEQAPALQNRNYLTTKLVPENLKQNSCKPLSVNGTDGNFYSLPALEEAGVGKISRLPICIRIVLESILRNCDDSRITEDDIKSLANWNAKQPTSREIPFVVSRIILQDFTGVPLLVDLAVMRDAVKKTGKDPALIEPLVPVDLVIDHSVQVDRSGTAQSFLFNLKREFERNRERYEFLKWGQQAFDTFNVVPPAIGIVHQVNLEYLAKVVFEKSEEDKKIFYPDTLVGTDSHTTMINGLGIIGWGVGGIEAEAGMLGQPIYIRTPEVIGVNLTGQIQEGVTATDLTLCITQLLRAENVVGKFVEFYGEGTANLTVADRATIANMAPEYGATIGFFPIDEKTIDYLNITGRDEDQVNIVREYFKAQGMFGIPQTGDIDYTKNIDLDISGVKPSTAGPKRPQDRVELGDLKNLFNGLLKEKITDGGFAISDSELCREVSVKTDALDDNNNLNHGSVVIAAITSCTNTSNPSVMLAAGLLAKKAVEKGLTIDKKIKTSLAPGSRVVSDYLEATDLQKYLDELGFNLVGYGCTTCIGNSGPLDTNIENAINEGNLVVSSVLSGNRNFEARIHSAIKANFLMSPPLVVAFALAGRINIDMENEPLGNDKNGNPVFLKDVWPSQDEILQQIAIGIKPEIYRSKYGNILDANEEWKSITTSTGALYDWDDQSTYIQKPPYFDDFDMEPDSIEAITAMRPLAIFGDSVTTDHISPAGAIPKDGPAGRYLIENNVKPNDFNSFGSRRGNDRVMTRGTFANVRIKNLLAEGKEGGWTKLAPEGEMISIYDACQTYSERNEPLIVFGGKDYGMGSSRDWAAKGSNLLGVKVVIAESFERIHRSNLIGMGILPLVFKESKSAALKDFDITDTFSLNGLSNDMQPREELILTINHKDGSTSDVQVVTCIDTPVEIEYYRGGGILPYVLRNIIRG